MQTSLIKTQQALRRKLSEKVKQMQKQVFNELRHKLIQIEMAWNTPELAFSVERYEESQLDIDLDKWNEWMLPDKISQF